MSRLTVLQYITPSRLGGAEECFLNIVRDQKARGHRVIALTKRDTPLRPLLEETGVEVHAWKTNGKIDPKTLWKVCQLIRREKVDVIHTHLTTAAWIGSLAGMLTKRPVVAHVHAADSKTWFQFADYLVAVAKGVKKHIMAQGVPGEKIEVVYYGIDLRKYEGAPTKSEAKAALGLAPETRTVGVVASLQERKGHPYLLRALKAIEPQVGPVHALFAGEGPEEAALRALAAELGLQDRVHFLGFRSDVRQVLAACDVFTLPSRKEGLSIAVMEAMALLVPVVVTDIAGMAEVVRNEETGLLVPPFEEKPLGEAIVRLLQDDELGKTLAANGRRFLEANFDQKATLGRFDEFQEQVVMAWRKRERFLCAVDASI